MNTRLYIENSVHGFCESNTRDDVQTGIDGDCQGLSGIGSLRPQGPVVGEGGGKIENGLHLICFTFATVLRVEGTAEVIVDRVISGRTLLTVSLFQFDILG